ncbi:MAG TPA: M14 family metallopeptidase [Gemmatales bacterium]|nr:M14 family metallopeptidase [Gemmatales bacterium]
MKPHIHFIAVYSLFLTTLALGQDIPKELLTVAEQSDFQATSKHAEVVELCQRLAKASPRIKLITDAGTTGEGRKQPLLVIADPPIGTPEEARQSKKIIVMAFANIHAGEVDGKEGVLMLARELGLAPNHLLFKDAIFLVYPNLNADGNDRFKLTNRPGQKGPAMGMGIRENADQLDLNRDFVKLDSPEVRCLVKLFDQWNPHIIIDCHTTNGSYHRHVITYDVNKHPACDAAINKLASDRMVPELNERLDKKGGWKGFWYGNFNRDKTVWETYGHQPRFSTQYCALRQRIGILSESYSYASYKDRVLASKDFVNVILDYAAAHKDEIIKTLEDAAQRQITAEQQVALRAKIVPMPGRYTVLGYDEKDDNGKRVRTEDPKEYSVTYVGGVEATLSVPRPSAYLIPKSYASTIENLRRHGIVLEEVDKDRDFDVEVYKVTKVSPSQASYQKHKLVTVDAEKRAEKKSVKAGDYVLVKTQQPLGNLASFLLEPKADDGLTAWNYFDEGLKEGQDFPVLRVGK